MTLLLSLLVGCVPVPMQELPSSVDESELDEMSASEWLTRASIDLRGVRPSVAELELVENDRDQVVDLIEQFLLDDRFGGRVSDLYAEIFRTNNEIVFVDLEAWEHIYTWKEMTASIGRESREMLRYIAENDLPYTDLVTADYTVADERLAEMWDLDYPEGETGWHKSYYQDGRPTAGLLSANGLWWYVGTTDSNMNRGRANTATRTFLCQDYLKKPIDFDRNLILVDEAAIADAINNDPGCQSCHISMDPIASHFFGFYYNDVFRPLEIAYYHPDREIMWQDTSGRSPGYFGTPTLGLADLGRQMAADSRYPQCMVERTYELLMRRPLEIEDSDTITGHRETFLNEGLTVRALFRSIVNSPEYRVANSDSLLDVTHKMVTPDLLSTVVQEITGFEWLADDHGFNLMEVETDGYLTLAGGADGYTVTRSAMEPSTTVLLVQERLAEAAAEFVVSHDEDGEEEPILMTRLDWTETPSDPEGRERMVVQLQDLHMIMFGHRIDADGPEIEANLELWQSLYDIDPDVVDAWVGLVAVLLRDPDFLFY